VPQIFPDSRKIDVRGGGRWTFGMKSRWLGHVTVSEAAARLGISRQRVRQLLRDDRIPFKVDDKHPLIKISDFEQFASIRRSVGRRRKLPLDD
jgi:excisionase family DNA binding protein